jgi:ATP-dependent DNA ligase
MQIVKFSSYLKTLENTASRNQMTKDLARLFSESSTEEIDKICYLILGRLAPKYEGIEFNMAEKMIIRAIAKALDLKPDKVEKKYKQIGDLGEIVLQGKTRNSGGKKHSVADVYNKLMTIANQSGEGSVEKKINSMAKLLKDLDGVSAKYIARIPVNKLRLGFSDMTILDALSWMKKNDKSLRPELEKAFNVLADIGQIAKIFKQKGLSGIRAIESQVGVPIRAAKAERLSSADKILEKMGNKCALEPKYDGFRCVSGHTGLYIENRGFICARNVRKGDCVLTHLGRFKKITAVNKRKIDKNERYFKFQTLLGSKFYISEKHKILVWQNKKAIWKPVEEIIEQDSVVFPLPKIKAKKTPKKLRLSNDSGYKKTIFLSKKFFRFLGFWMGAGFINNYHNTERISLHFNAKKEKRLCVYYKNIIKQVFKINNLSQVKKNIALVIYWMDKPLRQWLTKHFRRELKSKTLLSWFAGISKDNFNQFLKGWIEADGYKMVNGDIKIITKDKDLAVLVQLLALNFNKIVGLERVRGEIADHNFTGIYYELIIPKTNKHAFFSANKLIVKVLHNKELKNRNPKVNLYNFQVEVDKSYASSLAVLHNCQIHLDKTRKLRLKKDINLSLFKEKDSAFVRIFSRNLDNMTYMFPDVVEAVQNLGVKKAIFDSEAIAFNKKTGKFLSFQQTVQRKRKHGVAEKAREIPLKVFIFDLLYLNGQSLLGKSFIKRRQLLEKTLDVKTGVAGRQKSENIRLTEQKIVTKTKQFDQFFQSMVDEGLEGLMAKKLESVYQAGARNYNWVKYKVAMQSELADTIDCVVMGYYRGKGKRASFGIGAFLVGIKDNDTFQTVSKIGTGLTDKQWQEMHQRCQKLKTESKPSQYQVNKNLNPDVWCPPELVVEIEADTVTRSPIHSAGLALRFPRLKKFRDDKDASQGTTLKELKKIASIF